MAFEDIYPTPSMRDKQSTEQGLVYCKKCGFPCRTEALIPKGGSGNSRGPDLQMPLGSHARKGVSYSLDTHGTGTRWTPHVNAGCPMCGTFLFAKETKLKETP